MRVAYGMSMFYGICCFIVGMLWIDVEGSQYWSSNTQSNVDFIQGLDWMT